MSSTIVRGGIIYAKLKDIDGQWRRVSTELSATTDEKTVDRWIADHEKKITNAVRRLGGEDAADDDTLTGWVDRWGTMRADLGIDGNNDANRIRTHVLPDLGTMRVVEIRPHHLVQLFAKLRKTKIKTPRGFAPPAPRTIYNVYSALCACFRDAMLENPPLADRSPCVLTELQLGPKMDGDREWRVNAHFSRAEAEQLISSPKIPWDRRVEYAIELLAGARPGEVAALRLRHYDRTTAPLRALLVASALETKKGVVKETKTGVVKVLPVHPTLAAVLDAWLVRGWEQMVGRPPGPDDLIVPIPPKDAALRTKRSKDEPFRTYYYSGRRWREQDIPALEWRHRRHYDLRATFITLCLDDGADQEVIEHAITHVRRSGSAFAGYARGDRWQRACAEVSKLRLELGPGVVQAPESQTDTSTYWLRRRASNPQQVPGRLIQGESESWVTYRGLVPGGFVMDHAGPNLVQPTENLVLVATNRLAR